MKTILTLLLLIVVTTSCQLKKSDNTETAVTESTEIDNAEDCTADTVKATAIFWIDKAETKHCKEYGFRTIKAHVLIREDGKVDLMSFVKKQPQKVRDKIIKVLDIIEQIDRIPTTYLKYIEGTNGLFEVRVQLGNNIFRIFCFFDGNKLVVLLSGFQKKTQKTPPEEIKRADGL